MTAGRSHGLKPPSASAMSAGGIAYRRMAAERARTAVARRIRGHDPTLDNAGARLQPARPPAQKCAVVDRATSRSRWGRQFAPDLAAYAASLPGCRAPSVRADRSERAGYMA